MSPEEQPTEIADLERRLARVEDMVRDLFALLVGARPAWQDDALDLARHERFLRHDREISAERAARVDRGHDAPCAPGAGG